MVNLKTDEDLLNDIQFCLRLYVIFLTAAFILFIMAIIIDSRFCLPLAILSLGLAILFDIERNADLIRIEQRVMK